MQYEDQAQEYGQEPGVDVVRILTENVPVQVPLPVLVGGLEAPEQVV